MIFANMPEQTAIAKINTPVTRDSLKNDLQALGIVDGDIVLVHTSLKALGWVSGGAVTVINALMEAVGPTGTLVMPTHSSDLTDPEKWGAPPVPKDWVPIIRDTMPAYDPERTPTRNMGAIPELFRTWPDVKRSRHPACSFAAIGPQADSILRNHALESPLGEQSPLARLYDLDAKILLVGVGFDKCTSLHLAEQRAWPDRQLQEEGAPINENGMRKWVRYTCAPTDGADHFLPIGDQLLAKGKAHQNKIGLATATLVSCRQAIDHAVAVWQQQPG